MPKKIYYKAIDTNLYKVKTCLNWYISAESIHEAVALANKRGVYKMADLEHIGTCTTILGHSDNYNDVINMREKLRKL